MAKTKTFLQLPPELGGLRFGPFDSVIRIGSDPKQNQIVLDPGHGVFPTHAVIHPMDTGRYTLAPITPDCKLFVMPAGQAQVWPVTAPVQASAGDLLIVGTPHGPRFQLQQEGPKAPPPGARDIVGATKAGGEQGFVQSAGGFIDGIFAPKSQKSNTIAGEISRRGQASMLAKPGPLRDFYQFWTRFRSGAFSNPYTLVAVALAIMGLFGTGTAVSCSGVLYTLFRSLGIET